MLYYRYCSKVNDFGKLVPVDTDLAEVVPSLDTEFYRSLYMYNEEQKEQFESTGSVRGITEVVGKTLYLDFDSRTDIDKAAEDTFQAVNRLLEQGLSEDQMQIFFSGSKGFGVEVALEEYITPKEHAAIAKAIAGDLETYDTTVNNASRIIRVENTTHQNTGLHKLPISLETLSNLTVDDIKAKAKLAENAEYSEMRPISKQLFAKVLEEAKEKERVVTPTPTGLPGNIKVEIDFSRKPKFLSNCKFALLSGHIPQGQRQIGLTALAATYKNLGFDKNITYDVCKGALRRSQDAYGEGTTQKADIWNNIIPSVYSPNWEGGTYSCRTHPWMKSYCESLGSHTCTIQNTESLTISLTDTAGAFEKYAEEFEKNTIYSGVPDLDAKCRFLVGTSSGLLAAPSVGKSSLMFQILNHNSLIGNDSLFFSLDMYYSAVYTSLARRHSLEIGNKILTEDDVFQAFKNKTPLKNKIIETFKKNYENVQFCFKSGISTEDLANAIRDTEERVGKKMRLVVIDYSQLIFTNLSDPTASSALVANTLRKVANDCNVAMLTLFQPNKMNADPRKEITQYTAAKGSGSIGESMQLFLTMNRPGWSNQHPETDKFVTVNAVKNRSGPLFRVDMGWEGATGSFRDLESHEYEELKQLKAAVEQEYSSKEPF
jgi:hypothetical protein